MAVGVGMLAVTGGLTFSAFYDTPAAVGGALRRGAVYSQHDEKSRQLKMKKPGHAADRASP